MSDYSWIKRIRKGQVLESRSGKLRIVRDVSHGGPSIQQTSVTFAIQRQSWTTRPYTVVNGNDLRYAGYRPVGCRPFALRSAFDKTLERDMLAKRAEDCVLRARDVLGVA